MADTSFDDFVRTEQQAVQVSDQKSVDWQAEKIAWLRRLHNLHSR